MPINLSAEAVTTRPSDSWMADHTAALCPQNVTHDLLTFNRLHSLAVVSHELLRNEPSSMPFDNELTATEQIQHNQLVIYFEGFVPVPMCSLSVYVAKGSVGL